MKPTNEKIDHRLTPIRAYQLIDWDRVFAIGVIDDGRTFVRIDL